MYYLTDKSDNTKEIQQSAKVFHFLKADICFKKSSAGRGIPVGIHFSDYKKDPLFLE